MKITFDFFRLSRPFALCLPCLLLLPSCQEQKAENPILAQSAIAHALPLDKITIDGSLDDWPQDMVRYPIQNTELGDKPKGRNDFEGHFYVGYGLEENAIYVAMEITDESTVIDTNGSSNWDSQDGLELYVNELHLPSGSPVSQYSEYGADRLAFGGADDWKNIEMEKRATDKGMTVEWRIDLDQKIQVGRALGMDLVVIDKDGDDSFSWISWGRGTQKVANPDRCGTILPLAPGTDVGTVYGKVDRSGLKPKSIPLTMRLGQIGNPKLWVQLYADSLGNFSASLPLGDYQIDLPSKLISTEDAFYRIAPSEPLTFTLVKDGTPPLTIPAPELMPKPDLIPEKGLLHDFGETQKNQVDEFVHAYQEYYDIPGVSLTVIEDGKVAYHKTYGVKNTSTKEPVTEKTLFEAASITKPVFAFVVLRMADRGLIDLDRPLHEYLPFDELERYPEYKKMTAKHVLIHRSGLPNWGRELKNTPGEKYGYSGEGFEYLKRVVTKIMDRDIEQILDEELMVPFGLYHMEFSDSEALRKVVSAGHMGYRPTNWGIPQEAGMAFSMHTEAKAFSKYALTLLEEKGLKAITYRDFMTIHTESDSVYWNDPNNREGPGLGIFVRESDYGDTFYHGGSNGDFKCLFEIYRKLKMGYVVFTNSETGSELTNDLVYLLVEGKKKKR